MTTTPIFDDVVAEILRAEAKFGRQYDVPDVDPVLMGREGGCTAQRMAQEYEVPTATRAKFLTDLNFSRGVGTWAHILVEEVAEAIDAAADNCTVELREELVQVAAVALRWIDALDERGDR